MYDGFLPTWIMQPDYYNLPYRVSTHGVLEIKGDGFTLHYEIRRSYDLLTEYFYL